MIRSFLGFFFVFVLSYDRLYFFCFVVYVLKLSVLQTDKVDAILAFLCEKKALCTDINVDIFFYLPSAFQLSNNVLLLFIYLFNNLIYFLLINTAAFQNLKKFNLLLRIVKAFLTVLQTSFFHF